MSTNSKYPRGSEWRKWDLHIHSPLSILNNQYPKLTDSSPDWESFIAKLESLDVAAIGITDYFTIDGYKKVKEFKRQGRLANIHTILPNIEFRLDSVLSSRKDGLQPRRLNFHVIFSDEVSEQDIEEHFLHDLDFFYEGNPQDKDDKRKLKTSNIEALGKDLMGQHQSFRESGLTPLEIGARQTVVNHLQITERLKDNRFKGKYIVVFPEELSNLISWDGQDHHIRKGLLQKSDMVFSSNSNTMAWCLGLPPYSEGIENFLKEFKTCKPCIHGSDAHKIDEIGYPCALRGTATHKCADGDCELRYCWIKADPTFEGLKQLLYEPEDRVLIQQKNPMPIKSNYTLRKFKIGGAKIAEELSIQEAEIELNPGLVTVTGGRGSGKTAFVDLIANCYKDRCYTKDRNSFVRRIADQVTTLETTITFEDQKEFGKKIKDRAFFEDSEIVYIAQGELEEYIGEESDLDVYIKNLIFESPLIKDTVINYEFDELGNLIKQIEGDIFNRNRSVLDLEDKTSEKKAQSLLIANKQREAELKDIYKRLIDLEKEQNEEKIKIAKDKQKIIAELKTQKENFTKLKDLLIDALNFLNNDLVSFNEVVGLINTFLTKVGISEIVDAITYENKHVLEKRLVNVKDELTKIVKNIEDAQKELEQHEAGIKDHAKLLEMKREIEANIASIKDQQEEFIKNKDNLKKIIDQRKELLKQLITSIIKLRGKYDEIINVFSAQKASVLSDLSFGVSIVFNNEKFCNIAEDIMDNRKVVVFCDDESQTMAGELFRIIDLVSKAKDDEEGEEVVKQVVDNYVTEIEKINSEYKNKLKTSQAISIDDYYNFLFGNYFTVIPNVKYKDTQLSKLSLGQKTTVLIKIYLAQGDKPIVIDSHDDHLDNESIMDELVLSIRQAKNYRQIILASNNGNVVINSDAEQVIIANRSDGIISYIAGSIENPIIRERAVKVLEGGSTAFKQRQQKYRLN